MAKSKIILLDSDVISHFMSTAKIDVLPRILSPHHLYIVDDVYRESIHHPIFEDRKQELDNWISKYKIQRIARFEKDVIASSNFRDVADYCEEFSIEHIHARCHSY